MTGYLLKFQHFPESVLWVEIRWRIKRELYTAWRSNALEDSVH
jgi:hypothetical protein